MQYLEEGPNSREAKCGRLFDEGQLEFQEKVRWAGQYAAFVYTMDQFLGLMASRGVKP